MAEAVPPGAASVIVHASRGGNHGLLHRLANELSAGGCELILAGPHARKPPGLEATIVEHVGAAAATANLAAARATGQMLVFVDGRATLPESAGLTGWIAELVSHAGRSGVGVVSGRLINADATIRHGGTAVDLEDLADYPRRSLGPGDSALLRLWDVLNPAAATEDLMAVRAETFRDAGGFDEARLPSRFFGLDLAFRLEERRLRSVYTPYAALICGDVRAKPSSSEIAHMWHRWQVRLAALESGRWPPHDRRHRTRPSVARLPGIREPAGVAG